ncbi:MAG: oligopeptide transporter permease, partial [Anaerolineae bacterium]|nr:oligopeptide transporter permease [Anaerolineae bacterium]
MINFVIRRIGIAIPTLLILIAISFFLMHAAPGGPFNSERGVPPEVLANLNAKYGLDQPLIVQLWNYIWDIITKFDFGPSMVFKTRTVNDIIAQGFPVTFTYGTWSFVVAVVVGVSLGVAAAVNHNSWLDYIAVG